MSKTLCPLLCNVSAREVMKCFNMTEKLLMRCKALTQSKHVLKVSKVKNFESFKLYLLYPDEVGGI